MFFTLEQKSNETVANEQLKRQEDSGLVCVLSISFLTHSYLYMLLDLNPRLVTQISEERLGNRVGCAIAWSVRIGKDTSHF
ncbi:hypothetical protein T4C_12706 [Trichinella pseudospiralis]|uniref:Uncharacterized protein n=1 Tax=Trichinella pseudospiralis TaxID=6337 RepID=A0A0V1IU56_TRIPS|nr:hypothetical protein T4D_12942 [Trichinella pseudospiralis]KRZ26215.1 hypothetical protein T4C_12706 [Trichinella pseudospiralis]